MADVVIVTGGARGIGEAVCRLAAQRGYSVCINYREKSDRAEALAGELAATGARIITVKADVGRAADVQRMFETVDARLGPLTGLVNSAGIAGPSTRLDALAEDVLRAHFDTNVIGSFLCAREAVHRMSTAHGGNGGAIVNLSSAAAVLGAGGERVHYAATKGAIDSFTVGLGRELGREGIRVNAVRPGLIDTEMNRAPDDPDRLERLGPSVPMGRTGTAAEVAEGVMWLLSDAASYVTGTILTVSGGR